MRINPIIDTNGNYLGPLVDWTLVTEKVKMEKEAQQSVVMPPRLPCPPGSPRVFRSEISPLNAWVFKFDSQETHRINRRTLKAPVVYSSIVGLPTCRLGACWNGLALSDHSTWGQCPHYRGAEKQSCRHCL